MGERIGFQRGPRLLFAGVGSVYGALASATIGRRGWLRGTASYAESRD
jgi:hypothetical protein